MIWFEKKRIPPGRWTFLNTVRNGLAEMERTLEPDLDLTEGSEAILITGCMRAYRQAIMQRVLDLAQSVIVCWNAGLPMGALVNARSLLETIATFHSFMTRAEAAAKARDWARIGRLVDAYAFSTSSGPAKGKRTDDDPPRIGNIVKAFIGTTEAGREAFWDQICDTAHPNGKRMSEYAGILKDHRYRAKSAADSEPTLFPAVYNTLHSCCWLIAADLDFEILLEVIRGGGELPDDYYLIVQRSQLDELVAKLGAAGGLDALPPKTRERQ